MTMCEILLLDQQTGKSNECRVTAIVLVWRKTLSHYPCKLQLYKWGIDAVKLLRSLLMLSVPRQQGGH